MKVEIDDDDVVVDTAEANKVRMIVGLSVVLGTYEELQSSTILSLPECLRRLHEMKIENDIDMILRPISDTVTFNIEGGSKSPTALFGKAIFTKIKQAAPVSDLIVEKLEEDNASKSYIRLPQLLIDQLKLNSSDFENQEEFRKPLLQLPPPVCISTKRKRVRRLRRSSVMPKPQLGYPFVRKAVLVSKPTTIVNWVKKEKRDKDGDDKENLFEIVKKENNLRSSDQNEMVLSEQNCYCKVKSEVQLDAVEPFFYQKN